MVLQSLEAIRLRMDPPSVEILDQLQLPHVTRYFPIENTQDAYAAIKTMQVRGAPAIAIVGVLGVAMDLFHVSPAPSLPQLVSYALNRLSYVQHARPTAVNIFQACQDLSRRIRSESFSSAAEMQDFVLQYAKTMLEQDVRDNRMLGDLGARWLCERISLPHFKVLTHCNAGSLATGGYGTALGVIRRLHELKRLEQVYCTETRPYNQGSRLTAYELVVDELPQPTLICDNMASALLLTQKQQGTPVAAVIVGADRVAANGDTANKIGTYQLAITAKFHGALFIVVAPTTSVDLSLPNGSLIPVEERPSKEMVETRGVLVADGDRVEWASVKTAADISTWNPAFDVTPASLIDAIVTEEGVFEKALGDEEFQLGPFQRSLGKSAV